MGADGFSETVKYEADINAALQKVRQKVFDSGEYNGSENGHETIDDIFMDFELIEAGGTATIIDVTSVGDTPDLSTAAPLSADELNAVFGTTKPTANELKLGETFFGEIERGHCRYVVLYDDSGEPSQIHFSGYSWD